MTKALEARGIFPFTQLIDGTFVYTAEQVSAFAAAAFQSQAAALEAQAAQIAEQAAEIEEWRKHADTLTHQVICCGVAASHPDATLTTRGAYAGKWNSKQAGEVRKLRAEKDAQAAQIEALRADAERGRYMLKNAGWYRFAEDRTMIVVQVAPGSDLSCYAMREAAIDAAMAAKGPR